MFFSLRNPLEIWKLGDVQRISVNTAFAKMTGFPAGCSGFLLSQELAVNKESYT
jgi:hypothetical protein